MDGWMDGGMDGGTDGYMYLNPKKMLHQGKKEGKCIMPVKRTARVSKRAHACNTYRHCSKEVTISPMRVSPKIPILNLQFSSRKRAQLTFARYLLIYAKRHPSRAFRP